MRIALILSVMFICSCTVNSEQIDKAMELCSNNGGINYIDPYLLKNSYVHVICKNGAEFQRYGIKD